MQPTTTEVVQECVDLRERQLCDPELRKIVNYLENRELPTEEKMALPWCLAVHSLQWWMESSRQTKHYDLFHQPQSAFQEAHAGPSLVTYEKPKSIVSSANTIGGLECIVILLDGAVHVCPVLHVELDIRSGHH